MPLLDMSNSRRSPMRYAQPPQPPSRRVLDKDSLSSASQVGSMGRLRSDCLGNSGMSSPLDTLTRLARRTPCLSPAPSVSNSDPDGTKDVSILLRHGDKTVELQCRVLEERDELDETGRNDKDSATEMVRDEEGSLTSAGSNIPIQLVVKDMMHNS